MDQPETMRLHQILYNHLAQASTVEEIATGVGVLLDEKNRAIERLKARALARIPNMEANNQLVEHQSEILRLRSQVEDCAGLLDRLRVAAKPVLLMVEGTHDACCMGKDGECDCTRQQRIKALRQELRP